MINYIYTATITKIIDGDTVDAIVDLGFSVQTKIRFRLNGIDTPELN
jgi:micrococcal nuclease